MTSYSHSKCSSDQSPQSLFESQTRSREMHRVVLQKYRWFVLLHSDSENALDSKTQNIKRTILKKCIFITAQNIYICFLII